jgi:hypothetical protein
VGCPCDPHVNRVIAAGNSARLKVLHRQTGGQCKRRIVVSSTMRTRNRAPLTGTRRAVHGRGAG